jgi:hypothetical protein
VRCQLFTEECPSDDSGETEDIFLIIHEITGGSHGGSVSVLDFQDVTAHDITRTSSRLAEDDVFQFGCGDGSSPTRHGEQVGTSDLAGHSSRVAIDGGGNASISDKWGKCELSSALDTRHWSLTKEDILHTCMEFYSVALLKDMQLCHDVCFFIGLHEKNVKNFTRLDYDFVKFWMKDGEDQNWFIKIEKPLGIMSKEDDIKKSNFT